MPVELLVARPFQRLLTPFSIRRGRYRDLVETDLKSSGPTGTNE